MSLRDTLGKKRWIVVPMALLLLGTGLYLIFAPPRAIPLPLTNYFDLSTGKLVASDGNEPPEVRAHFVDAVVVSCGDCGDAKARTLAYIRMIDPKAARARPVMRGGVNADKIKPGPTDFRRVVPGTEGESILVAKPEANPTWLQSGSAEGKELMSQATQCPDGGAAKPCQGLQTNDR